MQKYDSNLYFSASLPLLVVIHRKLQDIVHQSKFLRPEAAQYISGIILDVIVERLDYMSLCGFACEAHSHHPKTVLKALDCIDIQDIRKGDG